MKHKRIDKIVSLVDKNDKVLDIGTDHGFVPIFLYKRGITTDIIAVDNHDKPLQSAIDNIKRSDLEGKIEIYKSDGVKSVKNLKEVDTIIIAGLGGNTISKILGEKNSEGDKIKAKLILHPTNNETSLRKNLSKLNYKIIKEELICENNVMSIIIKAKKVNFNYSSPKNQFLGPKLKKLLFEDENVEKYYIEKRDYYWDIYQKSKKNSHLKYHKWAKRLLIDFDINKKKRKKEKE